MSTETTNKKIKIDNGTTFGRTYTDKAVDELLKNAGGGGISVIELTDKNGTIASAQLGKINANPQNFAFKYSGKILLFTRASSTTYQYCNNTTSSSDNNVMTTSTLLTIESSTGVYTITENAHNVVANSIHPVNGGDLTNIQVGSKVYSIPSGGGSSILRKDGTFVGEYEGVVANTISLSPAEYNRIKNGEINIIYGDCRLKANVISKYRVVFDFDNNGDPYNYDYTDIIVEDNRILIHNNQLTITEQDATLALMTTIQPRVPTLPTDASSKTYTLKAVNGVLTWVE